MTAKSVKEAVDFLGQLNPAYAVMLLVGAVGAVAAHFVNRKNYEKFPQITAVYAGSLILAFLLTYALNGFFNKIIAVKYARQEAYYLTDFSFLYTTVFFIFAVKIFSLILGWDFRKMKEPLTASILVFLFFAKIGCFLNGCCVSVPLGGNGSVFPLNLCESGFALLFGALYFRKKIDIFYPFFLVYLPYRFFSEFIRVTYAYQKIFLGIFTGTQIVAAIVFSVLILFIVLGKMGRKNETRD